MKKMYFIPTIKVVNIQNKDHFLLPEASMRQAATNVNMTFAGAGGDNPAVARRQDRLWSYEEYEEEE